MKAQIICLDSPQLFQFYSTLYGLGNAVPGPDTLGAEIREIPNNVLKSLRRIDNLHINKNSDDSFSAFTYGSFDQVSKTMNSIAVQDKETGKLLLKVLSNYSKYDSLTCSIAGKLFSFNKCYIMGILNVTPDSFSDGGKYYNKNAAIDRAIEMLDEGADIIDIGGESTRPGAEQISAEEELRRILPVIERIVKDKPDAVISVDTSKSYVAEVVLKAGAHIINDISGLVFDPKIVEVAAMHNASLVIMHIKGTPADMQKNPVYNNVVQEIYDHLWNQTELAVNAGVKNIIIDPGIGFGKTMDDNFELLKRLKDFKSLGYPILIGLSRKSFLSKFMELKADDRDTASAIADTFAVKNGARIIRTHNVKNGFVIRELYNRLN